MTTQRSHVSRRGFLKTAAAVIGAPQVISFPLAGANAPANRTTIGCIGVGRMGRVPAGKGPTMDVPTLAEKDLGETSWEQRLVRQLRTRHYQWRTEQTYRMWANRFARWLDERSETVESATKGNIRDFLSDLATRQRGSASTQKQALNALVFLLREVLGKEPGDFSGFTRARKRLDIPVVLTREECRRLVEALEGTTQLMAELMYGSRLRLMNALGIFNAELPTSNAQRCPA
jgi:hypothetical protein